MRHTRTLRKSLRELCVSVAAIHTHTHIHTGRGKGFWAWANCVLARHKQEDRRTGRQTNGRQAYKVSYEMLTRHFIVQTHTHTHLHKSWCVRPAVGYSCKRFRRTLNLSYYCIKWPTAAAVEAAAAVVELINLCALLCHKRYVYILRIRRVEHAGETANLSYFRAQTEKLRRPFLLGVASLLDFVLIGHKWAWQKARNMYL